MTTKRNPPPKRPGNGPDDDHLTIHRVEEFNK
jgi:hypothetical protein